MVKKFLSQRGISFQERDVSMNNSYAQELFQSSGQMGVPVTIIDGQTVVGFDQRRLQQILNQRQTKKRPSFGAAIADASKITAKQGTGIILGAYVGSVKPDSPAGKIGLLAEDIVIEFNMRNITNAADLENALSTVNYGRPFSLSYLRKDKKMTAEGIL
jgi:S1-C subfamily serine protease